MRKLILRYEKEKRTKQIKILVNSILICLKFNVIYIDYKIKSRIYKLVGL